MNAVDAVPATNAAADEALPPPPSVWRPPVQRTSDILVIGWLHGTFQAAVFRRQKMLATCSARELVGTLAEFEAAFEEALITLDFSGSEVSLLLENDPFVHQTELAPGTSDAVAESYLKARLARHEKEHGRTLCVTQQTMSVKEDRVYILHMLPGAFYDALNRMLSRRRLVLARILPLIAPLQRELNRFPVTNGRAVLVAVEAGGATMIVVAQVGGQILLSRTVLALWGIEPARIALEINRSLLYTNQQFGLSVDRIWLLGQINHAAAQVKARCGMDKQIMVLPTTPVEWLQAVVKLPAVHPVNLVSGYLRSKRRSFYLRALVTTVCWVALGWLGLSLWSRHEAWRSQRDQMTMLAARAEALTAERDRLQTRNRRVESQRLLIRSLQEERLPAVAVKFVGWLAGTLPPEIRLSEVSVKWLGAVEGWTVKIEGSVEADDEAAREIVVAWERQLEKSPLRLRLNDAARVAISVPGPGGEDGPALYRFNLEGALLENRAQ